MFDRFYCVQGTSGEGCGRGLAIVKQIADRHAAAIELRPGAGGRGLRMTLRFEALGPLDADSVG